ncbi:MAG: hypothetical protein WCS65_11490 [Verrucomicrobiae bacterium]
MAGSVAAFAGALLGAALICWLTTRITCGVHDAKVTEVGRDVPGPPQEVSPEV